MDASGQDEVWDIHVHLASRQEDGKGGWIHPRREKSLPFRILRRGLGLSPEEERDDLAGAMARRIDGLLADAASLDRAVVLALDWARDDRGAPLPDLTDLHVPNRLVLAWAERYPRLRAGVSIHPYRPDALEELGRCAEAGAVLVKWLPVSQRFDPRAPRCFPFYDALARLGMPLLSHTGSEGATRNLNKAMNDPRVLVPALERGVTVVAAHAGMRSLPHDRDYLETWAGMLAEYPRLYGDTSGATALRGRALPGALEKPGVAERLVHGSDWPVPVMPWWHLGQLGIATILRLARETNPLQRDLAIKRALGVPEAVFTRGARLLRRGGDRS